jgi:hypothetical protein
MEHRQLVPHGALAKSRACRTAEIGFLVADLDATYQRALASGATDEHEPTDRLGMPRVAQVRDPSGNHVGLPGLALELRHGPEAAESGEQESNPHLRHGLPPS